MLNEGSVQCFSVQDDTALIRQIHNYLLTLSQRIIPRWRQTRNCSFIQFKKVQARNKLVKNLKRKFVSEVSRSFYTLVQIPN